MSIYNPPYSTFVSHGGTESSPLRDVEQLYAASTQSHRLTYDDILRYTCEIVSLANDTCL
tara:strand:+ start:339 stop:518 length:180 start_codon:yes stop_codon:yes gene_type:complete